MHGRESNSVKDLPSQMEYSVVSESGDTAALSKYRSPGSNKVIHASSLKAADKSQGHFPVSEERLVLVAGSKGPEPQRNSQECCMCGDIGLTTDLFRCCKCQHRLQHTYCSNWYPKKRSYAGVCNWCDTEGEHRRKQIKQTHPHSCTSNENRIDTSKVEKSSTKHGKRCGKGQPIDVVEQRNLWKDELDMLLDAAALTEVVVQKGRGIGRRSFNEVAHHDRQTRAALVANAKTSARAVPQTDHAKQDVSIDQTMAVSNCKDPPASLSKKIARRYKSVLDVY